ncbi:hypothetical protein DRJ17_04340 [Candidatus Woesearchaeota archaeon]|nr:MAG: hypothetical protein DRJ17_04340 [Candidatus Woesearchaeota archaeon]
MRILVNASNLRTGGGVQKAVEFINGVVEWGGDHQWLFLTSPQVETNISFKTKCPNVRKAIIPITPAWWFAGHESRKTIKMLEHKFAPDVVFTVGGPAYIRFLAPHLMGYYVLWVMLPTKMAWSKIRGVRNKVRFWLWCRYNQFWAGFADRWVTETDVAAAGLAKRLRKPREYVFVIPNSCSYIYFEAQKKELDTHPGLRGRPADEYRLLVFTAYYSHKNLESIPEVAAALKAIDGKRKYCFVLTLESESSGWRSIQAQAVKLGVEDDIVNIGTQPVHLGPTLYRSCDALFMPTLLETFTATYPEAMAMKRPIITTDLDFARDICQDAAMFFIPDNARSAAEAIVAVSSDLELAERLVAAGERRLNDFGSSKERFQKCLNLLEETAKIKR